MTLPFTDWLPHQRWYAGRNRTLERVTPAAVTTLPDGVDHVLLDVAYRDDGSAPRARSRLPQRRQK